MMHEVVLDTEVNDVLVAYLPTPKDLAIALAQGWYRIPVSSAPRLITEGKASYIAFYHPKAFGADRYRIRWYSRITSTVIRTRSAILPDEPLHPNAAQEYYVIGCRQMQELPTPIPSKYPRRAIFFPTTLKKLFTATDINHLFNDSPLETLLWLELNQAGIPSERQFDVRAGDRWFKLDFAIFCKVAKLGIECDSDTHHMQPAAVEKDKRRFNLLQNHGWHIRQFTTTNLRKEMPSTMSMVREAINHYGGLQDQGSDGGYRYTQDPDDPQPRLFD